MAPNPPLKLGVVLHEIDARAVPAIKFLITRMNSLQASIEFEIFEPEPILLSTLFDGRSAKDDGELDREFVRSALVAFRRAFDEHFESCVSQYSFQQSSQPDRLVVATSARFDDNFYSTRSEGASVVALGNWQRHMAPPSLVEFLLTLLLREVGATATPELAGSIHFGTRGCLFDFTPELDNVRYKVLNGFICSECSEALSNGEVVRDLRMLLSRRWIGSRDEPGSPAHLASLLGHDLTVTKALSPTFIESVRTSLKSDLTKASLGLIAAVVGGVTLYLLGVR